ncbi:hypothetical protein VTK26DRAFT_7109 [Humicola hyalothermophila]
MLPRWLLIFRLGELKKRHSSGWRKQRSVRSADSLTDCTTDRCFFSPSLQSGWPDRLRFNFPVEVCQRPAANARLALLAEDPDRSPWPKRESDFIPRAVVYGIHNSKCIRKFIPPFHQTHDGMVTRESTFGLMRKSYDLPDLQPPASPCCLAITTGPTCNHPPRHLQFLW